jgi:hypothetical protein
MDSISGRCITWPHCQPFLLNIVRFVTIKLSKYETKKSSFHRVYHRSIRRGCGRPFSRTPVSGYWSLLCGHLCIGNSQL